LYPVKNRGVVKGSTPITKLPHREGKKPERRGELEPDVDSRLGGYKPV